MNRFNVVCYGELLWDNLPTGVKPGGAPMNVAYHLQKLDMQPALISKVGKDERGEKLINILEHKGLVAKYIEEDDSHGTGVVNAQFKENNEVDYDIVGSVAWDFITWTDHFISLIQQADYFVYGSLAARSPQSRETLFQLLEQAKTKVLDINLRPPYFNQNLVEHLLTKADILKLNENELPLISGWYNGYNKLEDQVQLLQDRFSIPTIVVTRGSEGAILRTGNKNFIHKGFKVNVADTVGSGDAFLAGLLSKISTGSASLEALTFANALGAFMASQAGACPDYSLTQVQDLMSGVAS